MSLGSRSRCCGRCSGWRWFMLCSWALWSYLRFRPRRCHHTPPPPLYYLTTIPHNPPLLYILLLCESSILIWFMADDVGVRFTVILSLQFRAVVELLRAPSFSHSAARLSRLPDLPNLLLVMSTPLRPPTEYFARRPTSGVSQLNLSPPLSLSLRSLIILSLFLFIVRLFSRGHY